MNIELSKTTILVATALAMAGCATHQPTDPESLGEIAASRMEELYDYNPTDPLTLGEVAALTLARNGDIAIKSIERQVEYGQRVVNNLDYLPKLSAEIEKTSRDSLPLSTSARVGDIDLGAVDKVPSYSALEDEKNTKLGLRWDLLNVINTYYLHQQQLGKEEIARLNEERAAQNVVRDAQAAYHLKAADDSVGRRIIRLSKQLNEQLEQVCREIPQNHSSTAVLLEKCEIGLSKVHSIAGVKSVLEKADVKLAALIRVNPKYHIDVQPPSFADPGPLKMSTDELVEYTLDNRPELAIERTKINNDKIGEQQAWSKVLPSIEIGIEQNTTDNPFIVNDEWEESYVRVNWNLIDQVIGAPFRAQVAKYKQALGEARYNNLIVTSIGQVYLGVDRYNTARSRWLTNYRRTQIAEQKHERSNKRKKNGSMSELDHLIEQLNYVAQEYNYRADYAEMMDALSQLYLSMGIPMISLIEEGDSIESLAQRFNDSLSTLALVQVN